MNAIFLIGYMGSGKTTLGMALAQHMGVPFIDLDDYIEERCEATVSEIFASVGEPGFRDIERRCLDEVAAQAQGVIVACGGGTPCQPGNMELMNARGLTIWLTTPPQRIAARLSLPEQRAKRPLIAAMSDDELVDHINRHMAQREPHYSQAQLTFDSTHLESEDEIEATATQLSQLLLSL